ncbi:hypothetical protein [Sinomonas atrocyanea]|uniref:hypothetical protein n=1 Tax=Sinomonas atrocyanea TaxID=37927 RepID=UPI00285CF9DA|nr:hypothetical protein [Sinomonas atrocyanea]MDR6622390.1 hypothetical protein [Sinomonas atrocyanea]
MRSNYIRGASVTCSASQAEIQTMLASAGATGIRFASERGKTRITFRSGGHHFLLALPAATSDLPHAQEAARRGWRQLSALVQAKLDAVDAGITTFDEEFLAYMVMPGGATVFQAVAPGIAAAYAAAAPPSAAPPGALPTGPP